MKNFLKRRLPKKLMLAGVGVAISVIALSTVGLALLGSDRPIKQYQGPGTPGFDYVTFNSFTNVPNIGDERNFLTGKIAGASGGFYDPMNNVAPGDEILMRVYVHNSADPKHNASGRGVARNTKVRVQLPDALAKDQVARAYVSADNAQPQIIEDTLTIVGDRNIKLQYIPGSATIKTNFIEQSLSDNIVNGGVLIGDNNVAGNMKGCFEYVALVTLKVKVIAPAYSVQKSVRHEGGTSADWKESIKTQAGKTVEWRIEFKNNGGTETKSVKIVDPIDERLSVVPGSVKLYNGNYPNGYTYPDTAIQANGRQINVDIGNYNTGINAFVIYKTKVAEENKLKCGANKIPNRVYATPVGTGTVSDDAEVTTDRTCREVPKYSCDLLELDRLGGRKVRVNVEYTAENGAVFKDIVYNFGDGSEELVTDRTNVEHTFAKDGTYMVKATVRFVVDDQEQIDSGKSCEQLMTFKNGKPVSPVTPSELPNTGAGGDIAGLVTAVTIAGAIAHRLVWARRFARQ